jgi:hypothetical protein
VVRVAVSPVLSLLLVGCVFDPTGLAAGDGPRTDRARHDLASVDKKADTRVDSARDLGPDLAPDFGTVDDACYDKTAKKVITGPACKFETGDTVGQSGRCSGGKFSRIRYCFSSAPCDPSYNVGLCVPGGGCTPCKSSVQCTAFASDSGESGTCVGFSTTTGSYLEKCCAGASLNGPGLARTACTSGDECKTGICLTAGFCFEACDLSVPLCAAGQVCTNVQLTLGTQSFSTFGCVLAPAEAGPADLGLDSTSPSPDAPVPADHGVPDSPAAKDSSAPKDSSLLEAPLSSS